jgi:hypothetical protein
MYLPIILIFKQRISVDEMSFDDTFNLTKIESKITVREFADYIYAHLVHYAGGTFDSSA